MRGKSMIIISGRYTGTTERPDYGNQSHAVARGMIHGSGAGSRQRNVGGRRRQDALAYSRHGTERGEECGAAEERGGHRER